MNLNLVRQKTKKCTKCGERKPLSGFAKRADRPCGRRSHCKPCETLERKGRARRTNQVWSVPCACGCGKKEPWPTMIFAGANDKYFYDQECLDRFRKKIDGN